MFLQSVLDALPYGVFVTDEHLVVLRVNRWLVNRLGVESESMMGRPLGGAFPELAERGLVSVYTQVLQSSDPISLPPHEQRCLLRLLAAESRSEAETPQGATILALRDGDRTIGTLTVIEDHSVQLENERVLRREVEKLSTLRDSVLALASELNPDAVLDGLLDHVGRMVPFDSACVMLEENGHLQIKRYRSREHAGEVDLWSDIVVQHSDIPHLEQMMATGCPYVASDAADELRSVPFRSSEGIGSWAGVPIMIHGRLLGFLSLEKAEPGFYTDQIAEPLAAFAAQSGLALENARLYAAQQKLAITDGLTGLANRRRFDDELSRELNRTARFKHPTGLIMLDVDNFKNFNDTYGHPAGDELLKTLVTILRESVRGVDSPARYGGEEFALILPEAPLKGVIIIAERIRSRVESELASRLNVVGPKAATDGSQTLNISPVTVSIGLAVAPEHGSTPDALIQAADNALYQAKRLGKNQVVVYECNAHGN